MTTASMQRFTPGGIIAGLLTIALVFAWGFPLVWAFLATVVPGPGSSWTDIVNTYGHALFETMLGRWYINSLVTSAGVTAIVLAISSACGYAISQIRFYGRTVLWFVILASFMIPMQALIVNHFFLMNQWKLLNTWPGVILPQLIAPIAVIVYKQFFDGVPREYREAALIDGAKDWEIFLRIYVPLNWGITWALAIIIFIGAWNAFLWPFLAVTKPELMNITVGAVSIRYDLGELATALLAGFPAVMVFLLFQKRVTEAIMLWAGIRG